MFRDQTEADLFTCEKVPVRQGMCEATGGNPDASKPIGGNRAAEFSSYLDGRAIANRIAERRRQELRDDCDSEPMTMAEAVEIVLAGMGLRRGLGEDPSARAAGSGEEAGSDGVEGAQHRETAFRSALADNQPVCLPQPSQIIRPA